MSWTTVSCILSTVGKTNKEKQASFSLMLSLLHPSYRLVHGLKSEYFTQTKKGKKKTLKKIRKNKNRGKNASVSIFKNPESFETYFFSF